MRTPVALIVAALVSLAPVASAQGDAVREQRTDRVQRERKQQARSRDELELRRRRWDQKSQKERELLMKRYQELQRLSPEERQKLMERAQRFENLRKSVRDTAPEELKKEIDALEPDRRERRWREHTMQRSREMGRQLREGMPSEFRRRLENASPEERQRMLEHFARNQDATSRRAIRGLGRGLGMSREEVQRIEALPLEERLGAMMRLRRQMIMKRVQANGLPRGLDQQTWQRMQGLSDEEFLRHMQTIMSLDRRHWRSPRSHDGRGPGSDRGERGGRTNGKGRTDRKVRNGRAEDFSRNRSRGDRFQERNR